jgi:hypothetical protein
VPAANLFLLPRPRYIPLPPPDSRRQNSRRKKPGQRRQHPSPGAYLSARQCAQPYGKKHCDQTKGNRSPVKPPPHHFRMPDLNP